MRLPGRIAPSRGAGPVGHVAGVTPLARISGLPAGRAVSAGGIVRPAPRRIAGTADPVLAGSPGCRPAGSSLGYVAANVTLPVAKRSAARATRLRNKLRMGLVSVLALWRTATLRRGFRAQERAAPRGRVGQCRVEGQEVGQWAILFTAPNGTGPARPAFTPHPRISGWIAQDGESRGDESAHVRLGVSAVPGGRARDRDARA